MQPPFLVIATMNPLDHEGTYALPAAQMDRFTMQLSMGFPPPSPRSILMLARTAQAHAMSEGRDYVTPQDVQAVALDVLAHRLVVSGSDVAHGFLSEVIAKVPVP
jgi:MoxR-like ATPase